MTAAERALLIVISDALLEMGGMTHERTPAQRLADLAMAVPALAPLLAEPADVVLRRAREALAGPVSGVGRSEEAVGAAATVASQRASVAVDEPPYTNTGTTAFNGTLCIGCEITLDIADPSVVAAEPARNVGQ